MANFLAKDNRRKEKGGNREDGRKRVHCLGNPMREHVSKNNRSEHIQCCVHHTTTSSLHAFFQNAPTMVLPLKTIPQSLNPQETKTLHPRTPPKRSSADDDISAVISEDLAADRATIATTADQSGGPVSQFTIGDASGEGVLRVTLISLSASIRRRCTLDVRNEERGRRVVSGGGGGGDGGERALIIAET